MQKLCEFCGAAFEAKRASAKYCRPAHRVQMSQSGSRVVSLPSQDQVQPSPAKDRHSLVVAVETELTVAGRLSTSLGQQAMFLASQLANPVFATGPAVASMSRELREVMARALEGMKVANDPLDEIARRRDAKRVSG